MKESIYSRILDDLQEKHVLEVQIGINWTAVVLDEDGSLRCGLASTLAEEHDHSGEPDIPAPGHLSELSSLELASWINSEVPLRRSIGCAAINALLPLVPDAWVDQNAEVAILDRGAGKNVALIGHFPFVEKIRDQLGKLSVIDLNPSKDDFPASAAPAILPNADLVAITGMSFVNHTVPDLLEMCREDAYIIILGPSTPLTPIWADFGVDLLAGAVVEDVKSVLAALGQGATFKQLHKAGVRLVTQRADL